MRKTEAVWIEGRKRWQINVQYDGVRKTFTCSTPGRKGKVSAERKAEKWLESPSSAETMRVGTLLDEYEEYLATTKTKTHSGQYKRFIRLYIQPIIAHKRMAKLTESDLQDVIDSAYSKSKLSDKTLRDIRACAVNFIKWCRKHGKTSLYSEDLTIPAGAKKSVKKVIQPDGISKLLSSCMTTCRGKPADDWYIHTYRFAVLTGLRPGELRGLEDNGDINGSKVAVRRSINVHDETTQGKNNNARCTFVMTPLAKSEIDAQRAMLRKHGVISPCLFPSRDGEPMKHDHFYRCWKRYCAVNGIDPVSLYELRHTYVSVNKEMLEGLKKDSCWA